MSHATAATAPFLLHSNHDQEHFCFWVEFAVVL
jgi:hypothetical protein